VTRDDERGGDEFEQRPNVRWDNDFGPETAMWLRYVMAGACVALVFGFLAVVIFLLGDNPGTKDAPPIEILDAAAFVGGVALILAIALRGEAWAIRIRHFFERRSSGKENNGLR